MKKTEVDDFFKIILEKPNHEKEEITYRKINEKFNGDYAIVKAYSKDNRYANHIWMGIINKNFETIIPFRLWKLEMIDNNVLAQESKNITHHIRLNKDKIDYVSKIGKYEKVTNDVIKTESEDKFIYLYNLKTGNRISSLFTEIGKFQEVDGELVAYAKKKFPVDEVYRIPMEFKCYIDINGEPWSDTYNPFINHGIYLNKAEFDFCYEQLLKDFEYEQSEEKRDPMKVALKLKKKTRPNNK